MYRKDNPQEDTYAFMEVIKNILQQKWKTRPSGKTPQLLFIQEEQAGE